MAAHAASSFDIRAKLGSGKLLRPAGSAASRKATCGPEPGIALPHKVADRRTL